jgi:selenophosphate synthase
MLESYSNDEIKNSIDLAIKIMTSPNQNVVKTIHDFKDFSFIHAMSDVTGFGLAGHLAEMLQNSNFSALIDKVPSIKLSKELSEDLGYAFDDCTCHETAGGMLISVDKEYVEEFTNALNSNSVTNWIVGTIDKSAPGIVRVLDDAENIEVTKI